MKFVDEADIRVSAGKGGNGCLSFLREKFRPKGGPDGGDGGDGGSVYLVADGGLNTLADFRTRRRYQAGNGEGGGGQDRCGKNGADLLIKTPPGTLVVEADTEERIGEVLRAGERLLVARGGKGGRGNASFKSSTNRTPRKTTAGGVGDARSLKLELKVLADVGLLGLPNAGKSTLLQQASHARPKIAPYPFTTLHPQLGVVEVGAAQARGQQGNFVIADIPGLCRGAARGVGLGSQFLRHIKRSQILLHVVDIAGEDGEAGGDGGDAEGRVREIRRAIEQIEGELRAYDAALLEKERWLALNKADLVGGEAAAVARVIRAEYAEAGIPVYLVSAASGEGCVEMLKDLQARLHARARGEQVAEAEAEARADG